MRCNVRAHGSFPFYNSLFWSGITDENDDRFVFFTPFRLDCCYFSMKMTSQILKSVMTVFISCRFVLFAHCTIHVIVSVCGICSPSRSRFSDRFVKIGCAGRDSSRENFLYDSVAGYHWQRKAQSNQLFSLVSLLIGMLSALWKCVQLERIMSNNSYHC